MQNLVDRLQDGYRDKSIIKDLQQEGVSNVFSEESQRKMKDVGNIELYELSETVRTTQCPICLKHSKEGTFYCGCGNCLIPSQEHADKIRRRIDILAELPYIVKRGRHSDVMGMKSGNTITGQQWTLPKIAIIEGFRQLQEDGQTQLPTDTLNKNVDRLSNTACSWTTSRRSR